MTPDFPNGPVVSAWRLRLFPGKPSVSDDFLPKRQRNPMGDSHKDPLRVDFVRQNKLEFDGSTVQWLKEGNNAVKWTKLSCRRFKDKEARLQLFALAYNLAN